MFFCSTRWSYLLRVDVRINKINKLYSFIPWFNLSFLNVALTEMVIHISLLTPYRCSLCMPYTACSFYRLTIYIFIYTGVNFERLLQTYVNVAWWLVGWLVKESNQIIVIYSKLSNDKWTTAKTRLYAFKLADWCTSINWDPGAPPSVSDDTSAVLWSCLLILTGALRTLHIWAWRGSWLFLNLGFWINGW